MPAGRATTSQALVEALACQAHDEAATLTGRCVVAEPGRDLLLDRPAQGSVPERFTDLAELENRLAAFERRFNATATPFNWTFTADDLDDLLARIDAHEHPERKDPPLTQQAA